jgi:MFS family permease
VYLAGLAGFTAASALCALAPSAELLVGARVLQAAAAAAIIPASLAFVLDEFPITERATAAGLWGAAAAVSAAIGPTLGGALVASLVPGGSSSPVTFPNRRRRALPHGARLLGRPASGPPLPDPLASLLDRRLRSADRRHRASHDWGCNPPPPPPDPRVVGALAAAVVLTPLLLRARATTRRRPSSAAAARAVDRLLGTSHAAVRRGGVRDHPQQRPVPDRGVGLLRLETGWR